MNSPRVCTNSDRLIILSREAYHRNLVCATNFTVFIRCIKLFLKHFLIQSLILLTEFVNIDPRGETFMILYPHKLIWLSRKYRLRNKMSLIISAQNPYAFRANDYWTKKTTRAKRRKVKLFAHDSSFWVELYNFAKCCWKFESLSFWKEPVVKTTCDKSPKNTDKILKVVAQCELRVVLKSFRQKKCETLSLSGLNILMKLKFRCSIITQKTNYQTIRYSCLI